MASITGICWYWKVGFLRRFRESLAVYWSIASAAFLVFILVSLNETARQEAQAHFLVGGGNAHYMEDATSWLMVLGIFVAFFQTQFLMQRLIEDRYIEFGFLINVGVGQFVVGTLISLEQIGHSIVGGLIGILVGSATILIASLTPSYVSPSPKSIAVASASAIVVPMLAVLPISVTLLIRLRRNLGGIARVR